MSIYVVPASLNATFNVLIVSAIQTTTSYSYLRYSPEHLCISLRMHHLSGYLTGHIFCDFSLLRKGILKKIYIEVQMRK